MIVTFGRNPTKRRKTKKLIAKSYTKAALDISIHPSLSLRIYAALFRQRTTISYADINPMDASRPLLEKERDAYEPHKKHHHRVKKNGGADDPSASNFDCLSRLFPSSSATSDSSGRDSFGSGSGGPFASPKKKNGYHHHHNQQFSDGSGMYGDEEKENTSNFCGEKLVCTEWYCWKWIFPDRIMDYDDFATSAQVGHI